MQRIECIFGERGEESDDDKFGLMEWMLSKQLGSRFFYKKPSRAGKI